MAMVSYKHFCSGLNRSLYNYLLNKWNTKQDLAKVEFEILHNDCNRKDYFAPVIVFTKAGFKCFPRIHINSDFQKIFEKKYCFDISIPDVNINKSYYLDEINLDNLYNLIADAVYTAKLLRSIG